MIERMDNVGLHRAREVRAARAELWARRTYLYYPPPYSPELNDVERPFRTVKHHGLPECTYPTLDRLEAAVVGAFARQEAKLTTQPANHPRKAA